jgi:hypothetical protein
MPHDDNTFIADENSNVVPNCTEFHCNICGYNAEYSDDIENHVKAYKNTEKDPEQIYTCTFCGQVCETFCETVACIKTDDKEAKKPQDVNGEFDHLIPEERAFLINFKEMFEKICGEEVT